MRCFSEAEDHLFLQLVHLRSTRTHPYGISKRDNISSKDSPNNVFLKLKDAKYRSHLLATST